ncbi:MAG: glutathione S-transferase [Proteobacteria bacterium]|nr:glutathione S-transferase [Pseudomonadota bacterium]
MSTTLTYFDFDGSRGLECRLALTIAGVEFTDHRIGRAQWMELKPSLPYGALPVLEHDGNRIAHCTAILNWVGRNHGLLPTDSWAAAEHDAVMHGVEDLRNKIPGRGLSDEEKKTAREEFAAGWLTRWAETGSERIQGPFLDGDAIAVSDLKVYVITRAYLNDGYDHIPASFFDAYPKITALVAAVDAHPAVAAYWASRKD